MTVEVNSARLDDEDFDFGAHSRVNPDLLKAVESMSDADMTMLRELLTPRIVEPYFVHNPHPVQQFALTLMSKEVLFGGAAGGGKSDWLLMAALQYVDVPHYSALILRKTWPDLNAPGAILDRAKTWFADLPVRMHDEGRYWSFPSGATLQFGTLQYDKDVAKYQSAEYQFIGFDELTHWREEPYKFMFSRIRKPQIQCLTCSTSMWRKRKSVGTVEFRHTSGEYEKKCPHKRPDPRPIAQYGPAADGTTLFDVPLRMRAASNPGGVGHLWVRSHFIDPKTRSKDATFIPSLISDNPSLNQEEYRQTLMHLNPVARERMLNGDWDVSEAGGFFDRNSFPFVDVVPEPVKERVRYWDLAATVTTQSDWTVGALVSIGVSGRWYIENIVRGRWFPADVERTIATVASQDGRHVKIRMEQEPGSSGVNNISHYRRKIVPGYNFDGVRPTGPKEVRAGSLSSQAEAGNVALVRGQWNSDFLDEAQLFPNGEHDDQIDACVGGFDVINFGRRTKIIV